jgi:CheY-like chemotaxis protein
VLLSVSDTGHGMDADTAAKIFEPFFTTKPQGTGLGLATVYGLVRQHGGTITVQSQPGRGTTFNLLFPRVSGAPAPAAAREVHPAESPVPIKRHGTILLAEDESLVRDLIVSVLSERGFRVLVAADAPQALGLARDFAGAIDLLITDVIMPGMDGRQLHAALTAERPGLLVLYISGYSEEVIANHGVLEPGLHLLQKPFPMNQLLAKVNELLDG